MLWRLAHPDAMYRLLPVLILLCGCDKPRSESAEKPTNQPAVSLNAPPYLDHAQPKLRTMKLWLGPKEIVAELAITETEVATGMMYRDKMEENEGMLFIFGRPHRTSFYMKNTYVPLSCAYIDSEGVILEIHDLKPLDEAPVFAKSEQVQYVLEVKQGWFERNGVRVGAVVRTEHGSFPETFFRRSKENL
jgi:uncharacterized membrane protein (UPF0127 family)